jgi:hypothetical protein
MLREKANIQQTQDPFNPNNHSNQASSETVNNAPRLPPGFPKPLPPLKEIIRPAINAIKTMEIKDLCCV